MQLNQRPGSTKTQHLLCTSILGLIKSPVLNIRMQPVINMQALAEVWGMAWTEKQRVFIFNTAVKIHLVIELCSQVEACAVKPEKKRAKGRSLRDTMSDGTVKNMFRDKFKILTFNEVGGKSGELYQ